MARCLPLCSDVMCFASSPQGVVAGLVISKIEAQHREGSDSHPGICNATLRLSYQQEVSHAQYVEDIEDEVRCLLLPPNDTETRQVYMRRNEPFVSSSHSKASGSDLRCKCPQSVVYGNRDNILENRSLGGMHGRMPEKEEKEKKKRSSCLTPSSGFNSSPHLPP